MDKILEYNGKVEYNKSCYYLPMPKTKWVAPFGTRRIPVDLKFCLSEFFVAIFSGASEEIEVVTKISNEERNLCLQVRNHSIFPKRIKEGTKFAKFHVVRTEEMQNVENNNL